MDLLVLRGFRQGVERGIKLAAAKPETMNAAKWKQTAIDLPLVVLGSGVGYGVGRTVMDRIGEHAATQGKKMSPGVTKWAPLGMSVLSGLGSYALGRSRAKMRERREAASEAAK